MPFWAANADNPYPGTITKSYKDEAIREWKNFKLNLSAAEANHLHRFAGAAVDVTLAQSRSRAVNTTSEGF